MAKIDLFKKSKELGSGLVDKITENIDSNKLKDSMKNIVDASVDAMSNLKKRGEENAMAIKKALHSEENYECMLTKEDALKIIYCVMVADGRIDEEENTKFIEIANDVDENFVLYKDEFINEMNRFINTAMDDKEDYDTYLNDYVAEAIRHSKGENNGTVHGKLLLWNLLVIAYSDGDCLEVEKKLIRYCAKQLELDKSIILELEGYIQTLMAILKEEEWLKNTNRTFVETEKQLQMLKERKDVILQGVQTLVTE